METIKLDEQNIGCWLEGARGHYLSRDVIDQATEWGFIIGPFEEYAVRMYEEHSHEDDYPNEGITELCDEAIAWLNSGQSKCEFCDGTGGNPGIGELSWIDKTGKVRCKKCTGTGRGGRIEGQNFPPVIPEGTQWAFEDGDFGLWKYDEEGMVTE